MGKFQNDEITHDFITNAVMSASSLTSLGEVNDLSQITNPEAFHQTGASVEAGYSFMASSGRVARKTKGSLDTGEQDGF